MRLLAALFMITATVLWAFAGNFSLVLLFGLASVLLLASAISGRR